jgi:predicted Zn-dependent protease with MMP-like domain
MNENEFAKLVKQVLRSLPAEFKPHMDNVVVELADEPSHELMLRAGLTEEEIAEGETLLGLFDPLQLPSAWSGDSIDMGDMPHKLWIFRLPHLESFDTPEQVRIEIRKTVIHELAHHFGYTDRDLERFDAKPNPFKD